MRKNSWRRGAVVAFGCLTLLMGTPDAHGAALSIDEAVDMALKNNHDMKLAKVAADKAKIELNAAKGQRQLSLDVTSSLSFSESDAVSLQRNNSNRLNLSVPLYTGGRLEAQVAKAQENVGSKELGLLRAAEDIRFDVVSGYYNILQAAKMTDVNAQAVSNYEEHLANVTDLYNAGTVPKIDVLRSEVELADARQNLIKAQNDYDVAVSSLKSIIKLERQQPLELLDDAEYDKVAWTIDECIDYAREHRNDLKQYQILVRQAKQDVIVAKSGKRPSVSASVGNGWDKSVLPSDDNYSWTAGVSASWNIFDSNVTNANIKAAELAVAAAELDLAKYADAVDLEVEEAYLNLREAEKRFNTTDIAVQQAQEDYYIAREKYRVGEGIMLDIIDAQLALSTAQKNYIQARYDYATNREKLNNVIGAYGGDWHVEE